MADRTSRKQMVLVVTMINCKGWHRTWLSVVNHPPRDQRIPSVNHVTEVRRTTIVWQIAASKQPPRGPCICSRVCIGYWHLSWLLESLSVGLTVRTIGYPTPYLRTLIHQELTKLAARLVRREIGTLEREFLLNTLSGARFVQFAAEYRWMSKVNCFKKIYDPLQSKGLSNVHRLEISWF